jgi:GDPmannose 4,6-dehydratase
VKRALVTGITGQDGSWLAELLLGKGYEVHGIMRRSSSLNTARIDHIFDRLHLHHGDMGDGSALRRVLTLAQPDEIYNLAAMSHVRVSFDEPESTHDVVALGTLRLLEAVRDMRAPIRLYQASSSEQYGSSPPPQSEATPFQPRSPYAVAKIAAHWHARLYREAYGMHVSCGILFNHESTRRGETFLTRKVTRAVGRIKTGLQRKLVLGNLDARRDWGWAPDYVEGMWRMLQQPSPDDYVLATGQSWSVRQWVEASFAAVGIDEWQSYVDFDSRYVRPAEVDHLQGDASKARRVLGWAPTISCAEMVKRMMAHDVELAEREARVA